MCVDCTESVDCEDEEEDAIECDQCGAPSGKRCYVDCPYRG